MPQTTVNLPDGRRIHFPEGMPLDQVQAEVGKLTQQAPLPAPTDTPGVPQSVASAPKPAANGAVLRLLGLRPGVFGQSDPLAEGVTGAAKGATGSAYNVARGVSMALPGSSLTLPPKPKALEPTTTAEKVGHGAEQLAEFFAPAGLVSKVAGMVPKAATAARVGAEAIGAAGVSAAQGGNPLTAGGLSAATGAAGAVVGKAAPALKEAAHKKVVQALGPTKERYKAMARRIAPEILKRGLGGSRQGLMQRAANAAEDAGDRIDDAIQQFGARPVSTQPVLDALETAKDAFRVTNSHGVVVDIEKRAIGQLAGLQNTISDLGPDATVEQLRAVRMAWDKVVDQAGGFAHRATGAIGVPLKDQSEAWAKREGAGAIRRLLAQEVPELAAVNKEFAFWKSLQDVLGQTLQRTEAQGPGLGRRVAEVAGAVAGSGKGLGAAFLTGKLAQAAQAAFTSPRWRLLDARIRDGLADAIQSGSSTRVSLALARVNAALGSQLSTTSSSQ